MGNGNKYDVFNDSFTSVLKKLVKNIDNYHYKYHSKELFGYLIVLQSSIRNWMNDKLFVYFIHDITKLFSKHWKK